MPEQRSPMEINLAEITSFKAMNSLSSPPILLGNLIKKRNPKKISSSVSVPNRFKIKNSMMTQVNTVGIIRGISVFSTLIFLEKLASWTSKNGDQCVLFIACGDPSMDQSHTLSSSFYTSKGGDCELELNHDPIIQNLRHKRVFLEKSGARCIVMPCHISHAWHEKIAEGTSLLFLHLGECVAKELKEAKMKPLEAGSQVRIGILASYAVINAGFYQNTLQNQGFEVVLPDKATMEHIFIPAVEAFHRKDMEGARNLLRIAIQVLLIRAVNIVVLASDELLGLLPREDPLLKSCIDPMDALARATLEWANSAKEVHDKTSMES